MEHKRHCQQTEDGEEMLRQQPRREGMRGAQKKKKERRTLCLLRTSYVGITRPAFLISVAFLLSFCYVFVSFLQRAFHRPSLAFGASFHSQRTRSVRVRKPTINCAGRQKIIWVKRCRTIKTCLRFLVRRAIFRFLSFLGSVTRTVQQSVHLSMKESSINSD